jgi:HEAT repeat protein
MTGKIGRISLILFLLLPLAAALGCAFSSRGKETSFLETQQSHLYSEDPVVADRAAMVLLSSASDSAYRVLKAAMTPPNSPTTRAAVIRAFTTEHDARIRGEMIAALADKDETIAGLARSYLSAVGGEAVAPDLLAVARDASRPPGERIAALAVLGDIGASSAVEGIIDVLTDSNRDVAVAAVAALGDITYQPFGNDQNTWRQWYKENRKLGRQQWRRVWSFYYQQTEDLKSQIAALQDEALASDKLLVDLAMQQQRYDVVINVLARARPVEAQIYAAQALGKDKVVAAAAPLIEKLKAAEKTDPRLAKACIDALGAIGDPEATEPVAGTLVSPDTGLKLAGVKAYASFPQSDLSRLLPLADDSAPEIRAAVAKAVGARKWVQGAAVLSKLLQDPVPDVIAAAADALGQTGDKSAAPALAALVSNKDEKVRYAAVRSLTVLADASCYDVFLAATDDKFGRVREAAVRGLGQLNDKRAVDKMLKMVLEDVDSNVAAQAWTSLQAVAGSDPALILSLSRRLQDAGKFTNFAETLLKVLADSNADTPDVLDARRQLARAYLKMSNYQAARVYFQRILSRYPDDADALSGVTIAMRNLDDLSGLAGVYARQIAGGNASPDARSYFLSVLQKLLATEKFGDVAQNAQIVLASGVGLDQEFSSAVSELRAAALPNYLKGLAANLAGEPAARAAARDALAAFGTSAAAPLVEGLESASEPARATALELLVPLAGGKTFDFDPKKPPAEQKESLAQWQAWAAATAPK